MFISKRLRDVGEFTDLIDSDRWTLSLATTHDGYPVSKLKTDNLDDYARTWGQRQSHTTLSGFYDLGSVLTWNIDYISILGVNRKSPSGGSTLVSTITDNKVRVIIDSVDTNAHLPVVTPATFNTTNLTGTYDILNQVLNPPEDDLVGGYTPLALTADNGTISTVVTMQFNNETTRPLRIGVGLQTILVHVRDSVDVNTFPSVTATLRQAGSDVGALTVSEIEKTSEGYILIYRWNASTLPNLTGFVGLRLNGATTGTSTPEYMSVVFRAEVDGTEYDTEWQDIENKTDIVFTPDFELIDSGFFVLIQFSDLSIQSQISIVGAPAVPQYLYTPVLEGMHIGRFAAGTVISAPQRSGSNSGGFNLRKVGNNANSLLSSYGGQLRITRQDMTRWQADITFIPQSQSRMFSELSDFFDSVGFVSPALYIPIESITDPHAQHTASLWAIITSFEAPDLGLLHGNDTSTSLPHTEDKRFDLRMSIIEAHAHLTKRAD